MNSQGLVESFSEFKDFKNIDRPTMMKVLEDVFRTLLRKKYGSDDNFDVIVNTEKGDLEIWRRRTIVEDGTVEDPNTQIASLKPYGWNPIISVGEEAIEEVTFESFGRRAILTAKQTLASQGFGAGKRRAVIKNTRIVLEKSLPEKFTRYGKKKHCCWMMKAMNWCFPKPSRYLLISLRKVIM